MSPRAARWLSFARLVLGLALIVGLLALVDLRELGRNLASAHLGLVAVALALSMSNALLASLRWWILLRERGCHIPLGRLVRIYFVSGFLSNFLPSSMATDGLRIFYARGHTRDLKLLVSSMVLDRLVGFFAMAVIALLTLAALPWAGAIRVGAEMSWTMAAFSALALTAPVVAFHPAVSRAIHALLGRWHHRAVVAKLEGLYDTFLAYRRSPRALALVTGVAFLSTLRGIVLFWVVALALGADVSILYFFLLIPIMSVVESIPVSLAGLGVHEGAIVLYFSQVGVPTEVSAGIAIIVRGLSILGTLPGAVLYLLDRTALQQALARKEAP